MAEPAHAPAVAAATEIDAVFVMADLSGFTALTEAHGSLRAADLVGRYLELVRNALEPGVRLVERVGDEVVLVAAEAAPALGTALTLRRAIEREPEFPLVRAGIHGGRVVERGGEYFGTPLNVTARVTAHARAGQLLCTAPIATAARGREGVELRALGPVRFKNVAGPVEVFEVVALGEAVVPAAIDPVCRMQVDPEGAPARLIWNGTLQHFCSLECARRFLAAPEAHAP
ncbi:MAG: YHS domain-containing protein [Candidatus Rokubacteria bacterium]|nr:YHS domain-containing protein [Candidatus Rokubacteria bacterium]